MISKFSFILQAIGVKFDAFLDRQTNSQIFVLIDWTGPQLGESIVQTEPSQSQRPL